MEKRKEYRSAVRSRRLIRSAFLELLREKAYEKITVTDIVTRADINRSTFYAHYPDVRGLVEEIVGEAITHSTELAKGRKTFPSAGQQFMNIGLMSHIKYQSVYLGIENSFKCNG